MELKALPLPEGRLLLLDKAGTVLAKSRGDEPLGGSIADTPLFSFALTAQGGETREIRGPGGDLDVWASAEAATLQGAGLRIVAGAPRQALLAAANRRFGADMALLAGVAALTFLAVWCWRRPASGVRSRA